MAFRMSTRDGKARLEADVQLEPDDFQSIAGKLGAPAFRARKIGYVAARRADAAEIVETHWNGKETTNTARKGDWIVTNLSANREPLRDGKGREDKYVITADRFALLYEPADASTGCGSAVYRAKGIVSALQFDGGFDIVAPWGERQTAPAGYLILSGAEVYGSNAETFRQTYKALN